MKDDFKKYIKDNYHQKPIHIDVDDIWNKVEKSIDKKKRRPLIWLLFPFMLLLIGFTSYQFYSADDINKSNRITETIESKSIDDQGEIAGSEKSTIINKSSISEFKPKALENTVTQTTTREIKTDAKQNTTFQKRSDNKKSQETVNKSKVPSQEAKAQLAVNLIPKGVEEENSSFKLGQSDKQYQPNESMIEELETDLIGAKTTIYEMPSERLSTISRIPFLNQLSLGGFANTIDRSIYASVNPNQEIYSSSSKIRMIGELSSSYLFINRKLNSLQSEFDNLVLERNQSETLLEAIKLQATLGIQLKNGISFKTGLNVTSITERFDYSGITYEEYEREVVDTIIITGTGPNDFIELKSTELATQEIHREIRSYNRYRLINVPLIMGYRKSYGRFAFNLNLGLAFNLRLNSSGMILGNDLQVLQIDEGQFKSSVGLNYHAGLDLSYHLLSNVDWFIGLEWDHYANSFSSEQTGISQKYSLYGFRTGFAFMF